MKRWGMIALTIIALIGITGIASATTLDFEFGLTTNYNGINSINPTYGGFTWDSGIFVVSKSYFNGYGNTGAFPSGVNAAFNRYGDGDLNVTVAGGTINLNGAWFRGLSAYNNYQYYTSTSVQIEGFLGATSQGTASMNLLADQFSFLNTNFGPIDSFRISSSGNGKWWVMDDLTYNSSPVPEPSTMLLLGSGLVGLVGYGRRRLKK